MRSLVIMNENIFYGANFSSIVLYDRYRLDLLCASGFVALLTAVAFAVELIITVREGIRGGYDDE